MSAHDTHLALAKLLAAAAWADGRLEPEEINAIKQFMLHFDLTPEQAAEVSHLMESPVPQSQAEALTQEFLDTVRTDADKRRLIEHMEAIMSSDGEVSEEERNFLLMVRELVEAHSVVDVIIDRVRGLFTWGALRPRGQRMSSVAEVLRTRLQDRVRERLKELSAEAVADAERLNVAVLFGALLHRVAWADGEVSESEVTRTSELLTDAFGYEDDEIEVIADTLRTQVTPDVDVHRLAVEFNRLADLGRRLELVQALFMVASADGTITDDEVEEIRRIADFMWIDRREFNDIRLSYAGG